MERSILVQRKVHVRSIVAGAIICQLFLPIVPTERTAVEAAKPND
jgi:hypothetical protein